MNIQNIVDRNTSLFSEDLREFKNTLNDIVSRSKFLVIGGAGSIGQAVSKEIFRRHPKTLHIVDINENNMVELVRDIRSSLGYIKGDFQTYILDCGGPEFDLFIRQQNKYDYILNLSALKHVRSERDPFTLLRMINTNILNSLQLAKYAKSISAKNYFCVSTDKAANPANLMGASKRIMELFLLKESNHQKITMSRFANVAFSDGSLLFGFAQRIIKQQPIAAPCDVQRYFITPEEAGELCLLACTLGNNRDIFFPKLNEKLHLKTFSKIATDFLRSNDYEPFPCDSESEARELAPSLIPTRRWPCYFFETDTTGEKPFEEFYTKSESIDLKRFREIGVVLGEHPDINTLYNFKESLFDLKNSEDWTRDKCCELFATILPDFSHVERGKFLDQKM